MTVLFKCPFFTKKEKAEGSSKEKHGHFCASKETEINKGVGKNVHPMGLF